MGKIIGPIGMGCAGKTPMQEVLESIEKSIKDERELRNYRELKEQGKLIELPIALPRKVERIYEVDVKRHEVYEIAYSGIELSVADDKIIYTIDICDYKKEDFGKILFATEAEAEAKLIELEREGK